MIELHQSGPCCGLTINYKEPLKLDVDFDLSIDCYVVSVDGIKGYGDTVDAAIKNLSADLCVISQDTLHPYCKALRAKIDRWVWEAPDDTWVVGIIDKRLVVVENNDEK